MCYGTATYYVQCGHSAVRWQSCGRPRTMFCRRTQAAEEFEDATCGHRWCLCDGQPWACCGCRALNLWGDCLGCQHVRCRACANAVEANRRALWRFRDPREERWKARFEAQERERGRGRDRA